MKKWRTSDAKFNTFQGKFYTVKRFLCHRNNHLYLLVLIFHFHKDTAKLINQNQFHILGNEAINNAKHECV